MSGPQDEPAPLDPDEMLEKVKTVAKQITDRCHKVMEDTKLGTQVLPTDQTSLDGPPLATDPPPA
jgi:hypothetical protein